MRLPGEGRHEVGIDRKSNCGRSADGLAVDSPGGFGGGRMRLPAWRSIFLAGSEAA